MASIAEGDWRPLDPTAATLFDVDLPGDLPSDPAGSWET